jgi:hypothetical protein
MYVCMYEFNYTCMLNIVLIVQCLMAISRSDLLKKILLFLLRKIAERFGLR